VPHTPTIDCPHCERPLHVRRGGRCPHCGEWVADHVAREKLREKRIEQTVAILATVAVVALFVWGGGFGLLEGIAVYAVVGLVVWYWGKGTFWSETLRKPASEEKPSRSEDEL
jgi:predicted exporter